MFSTELSGEPVLGRCWTALWHTWWNFGNCLERLCRAVPAAAAQAECDAGVSSETFGSEIDQQYMQKIKLLSGDKCQVSTVRLAPLLLRF